MTRLTRSYVHGASSQPFLDTTIGAQFDRTVDRFGDREALVVCHQDVRWTYAELKEQVDRLAAGLLALGLEPGERIGICENRLVEPNNERRLDAVDRIEDLPMRLTRDQPLGAHGRERVGVGLHVTDPRQALFNEALGRRRVP